MPRRTAAGPAGARFVDETLTLIAESGGSQGVTLREISRRVGCAHTNVYNYYSSLEELLWAAFRRALVIYAEAIIAGLDGEPSGQLYLRRLVGNLIGFAKDNPGLYRFIGSDPIEPELVPDDIIATVTAMKRYFIEVVAILCGDRVAPEGVDEMGNILLAYLDGEVSNLINGRVLPGEDIVGRVVDSTERLFTLLSASTSDGIVLSADVADGSALVFPTLEVSS